METKLILGALSAVPLMVACGGGDNLSHPERPNVVFVLVDDMGIGDLNCYFEQDKIQTPNLDELAAHSLLFTQHYSGSTVSAPSRCCLMTGKHTGNAYIRGNKGSLDAAGEMSDYPLPDEETTVAELFKQAGYSTMCVGKWGLGGQGTSGTPIKQGFDHFLGYLSQREAHHYYPDHLYKGDERYELDGTQYSHFVMMDYGLDFLRRQSAEQPFFAYFSITPPHASLDYPDISAYEGKLEEPPFDPKYKKGHYLNNPNPRATYAAMVSECDKNVGQIIEILKSRGVWDNTILIFSSDNGVHNVGGHDPNYFDSNGIYRGYKRDLYEGGIRTPFIFSWPAVISEGRKSDHISAFWDFLPTMCDIIGVDAPASIDGISYLPTLLGNDAEQREHDHIYYEFYEQGGKQSVMQDGWKLIRLNMSKPDKLKEELYYLPNDISEEQNLIEEHPEKANELRKLAESLHTENEDFSW